MYGDLYPILTEKGGGRFPQMYAEEFVTAYERQIAEYKRLGTDVSFKSTVILNQDELAHNAEASQDHIGDTPTELPALQLDDDAIEDLEDNLAVEDVANEDLSAGDFDETPEEPVDRAKA